jgi:hypothetical protein
MILLTSTSDLVQVITGGTQAIKVHASYVDLSGTTVTPGRLNTAIASAATTTVVGSPAASTQRTVKFLSVFNSDAATADTVTVQHTDGTTVVILYKLSLLAGYTLTYNEGSGWQLFNAVGALVQSANSSGTLLGQTYLVSTQTFTTQTNTSFVEFEMVGGGGAGGGVTVTNANGAAGGGGAGAYLRKRVAVSPNTGYSFTAGAAGTGSSGAAGGNGSSSTFVIGATTYTAPGGTGGPVSTSATTLISGLGGAGGAVSTNGDLNATGAPGGIGVVDVAASNGVSGFGGSTLWGGGGNGVVASGNGVAGGGNGSGGGGGLSLAAAARTGGNGTIGAILIREYS